MRLDNAERASRIADAFNTAAAAYGSEEAQDGLRETIDALLGADDTDLDYMLDPDAEPDNEALEHMSANFDETMRETNDG